MLLWPKRINVICEKEQNFVACMAFTFLRFLSDFFNYAVLPYINGISQPLTRLLRKYDIRVVNKPLKTL